ncbi:alpha 1,2-mannosyltransferase 2.4.1, partial [Coemansia sp. RSA 989]
MLNIKWRPVAIIAAVVLLVHFLVRPAYNFSQADDGESQADREKVIPEPADMKHPMPVTVTVTKNAEGVPQTVTSVIKETVYVNNDDADVILERASAAFVVLTRNNDLKQLRETLVQLEDRFNRRYHYPYVFLNNEPFSDEFKEKIQSVVSGECQFGLIPEEHWSYPEFINQTRASEARQDMQNRKIIY